MTVLSIDLETYSDRDIKLVGAFAYVDSPAFEIMLMGFAFDDDPVGLIDLMAGNKIPPDVMAAIDGGVEIKAAFNAQFERLCLAKHFGRPMPAAEWRCTMIHGLYLGLPGSLEELGRAMKMPEDKQKLKTGKDLIQYFCKPCKPSKVNGGRTRNLPEHAPERWQQFGEYCQQDVEAEREIRKRLLRHPVPDSEHRLWCLDQEINARGVAVDMTLVQHAIRCDEQCQERLTIEARELTGLENPNSVAQLKEWLWEMDGIEVESLNKTVIPDLIEQTDLPEVERMLQLRTEMAKTSIKKYEAMDRAVCSDGRIRGLLQFYGANRTGRWAGRLVQVQNLPQNHIKDLDLVRTLLIDGDYDLIEILCGNVPDTLSQLIRTAFVPARECRFIVSDFRAIEARVIAWLANEKWQIEVFAGTGNIYETTAAAMFKVPVETIDHGGENYELRQKGKIASLACGYGGSVGAMVKFGALRKGLKEEELPGIVHAWRTANPNIVQFWWNVGNAAMKAVREKTTVNVHHGIKFRYESGILFLYLPSGRRLAYVRPRMVKGKFDNDCIAYEGVDQTTKRWTLIQTYGPKLVENICQAVARDCLAVAMHRLDEADYKAVMTVHDEVVLEVPNGRGSLQEVNEIMGRPIDWAPGLYLQAAGFETDYYKKD